MSGASLKFAKIRRDKLYKSYIIYFKLDSKVDMRILENIITKDVSFFWVPLLDFSLVSARFFLRVSQEHVAQHFFPRIHIPL